MLIENLERFISWLTIALEPICIAEPTILVNYIVALLKYDRPIDELRKFLLSQLEEFLSDKTETFIQFLVETLQNESYLAPVPVKPCPPAHNQRMYYPSTSRSYWVRGSGGQQIFSKQKPELVNVPTGESQNCLKRKCCKNVDNNIAKNKKPKFDFRSLGPKVPLNKVQLKNIPENINNIRSLNSTFMKFGKITNIQLSITNKEATITFSASQEAQNALQNIETVFGNLPITGNWFANNAAEVNTVEEEKNNTTFQKPVPSETPIKKVKLFESKQVALKHILSTDLDLFTKQQQGCSNKKDMKKNIMTLRNKLKALEITPATGVANTAYQMKPKLTIGNKLLEVNNKVHKTKITNISVDHPSSQILVSGYEADVEDEVIFYNW